jgi:hypothetical protein
MPEQRNNGKSKTTCETLSRLELCDEHCDTIVFIENEEVLYLLLENYCVPGQYWNIYCGI